MRRFLVVAFLSFAMASPSHADLVSTASVNPFGTCGSPAVEMGTSSASASACTAPQGGSASTSINFGITSSTLATWTFDDVAGEHTTSSSSSLFDYEFVVTGGTGVGFLTLNFAESGVGGDNDPQASASFNVLASLNGIQYSDVRICGNPPAQSGIVCTNPTDSIGVAFIYGTPFELSVALDAVAGGGLDFANINGGGTLSYSLPSQSDVLQNDSSTTVPEPTTAIMTMTGMFALLMLRRTTT
jgi:hypothetical protein